MLISLHTVFRKSKNVVFRKIGDAYVLVPIVADLKDVDAIYNLNETAAAVWERLDGVKSLGEIVAELRDEYSDPGSIEEETLALVAEMVDAGLLES